MCGCYRRADAQGRIGMMASLFGVLIYLRENDPSVQQPLSGPLVIGVVGLLGPLLVNAIAQWVAKAGRMTSGVQE